MSPIFDVHIHPVCVEALTPGYVEWLRDFTGLTPEQARERYGAPERLLAYLDENGVDAAAILAHHNPITSGRSSSELVAKLCAASPRLLPIGTVNPHLVAPTGREVERLAREVGCRGLKLYPTYDHFYPNDRVLYPLYAAAEALGLPVQVHTGSSIFRGARLKYGDPLYLDDVAVDFPGLKLLLSHGGRPFWFQQAFTLARLHPNVYIDLAGLPPRKLLEYFPDLPRLADKFVFGSDWPGIPGHIRDNVAALRALPLSDAALEAILWRTGARLYGLEALGQGERRQPGRGSAAGGAAGRAAGQ